MLTYTYRFFAATLKFSWKIFVIVGGLVFSSLGNAVMAMLNDDSHKTNGIGDLEKFARRASVCDEVSATRAFHNGDITSSELVNYQSIEK